MSETNTPTSTTTSVIATGNESLTLADEIKKYDTEKLIEFLQGQDLWLVKDDFDIIENERVNGRVFLKITEEKLRSYGMKGGPASNLADFAKECKEKKLRVFSTYLSLSEVLEKYGLGSEGIDSIPLFSPLTHEIQDDNKVYKRCMEEILGRLNLTTRQLRGHA